MGKLSILVYYVVWVGGDVNVGVLWKGKVCGLEMKIGCGCVFRDDEGRDWGRREVVEIMEG